MSLGKIIPGYNTMMMVLIMAAFVALMLGLAIWRVKTGNRLDILTIVTMLATGVVLLGSQWNVQRVKAAHNLPGPQHASRFANLASEMHVWVNLSLVLAGAMTALAVVTFVLHSGKFAVPWGFMNLSAIVNMLGIAVDYDEWRHITLLRAAHSTATFRHPEWWHYSLWIAALAAVLVAIVLTLVIGARSRELVTA